MNLVLQKARVWSFKWFPTGVKGVVSFMGTPRFDSDEEIKKWLNHIALICLSEDFQALKKELENIYSQTQMENAQLAAFKDALYAFLAQEEDEMARLAGTN